MTFSFKSLPAAALMLGAFTVAVPTTAAYARPCGDMVCHNNPTCQRLRNAGKCAAATAALNQPGGMSRSDNSNDRGNPNLYRGRRNPMRQ